MASKKSSYQILKAKAEQLKIESVQNLANKKLPEKSRIGSTIPYQQTLNRVRQDISTFRSALLRAENIHQPQRVELLRLYKDVLLDNHLSALIQNRKASILSAEFIVTKKGKEKEDKTELLKSKWFYDFLDLSMESLFFGNSLIQFGDLLNDEFQSIELVPREYTKFEFGIVTQSVGDITGVSFLEAPY